MFNRIFNALKKKEAESKNKMAYFGLAVVAAFVVGALILVYALYKFLGPF